MNRTSGTYEKLGDLASFIPYSLPPQNPPFHFERDIIELYGQTMQQLGQLNEIW